MKKKFSKVFAVMLAVCMVFTMMPAMAWADEVPAGDTPAAEGQIQPDGSDPGDADGTDSGDAAGEPDIDNQEGEDSEDPAGAADDASDDEPVDDQAGEDPAAGGNGAGGDIGSDGYESFFDQTAASVKTGEALELTLSFLYDDGAGNMLESTLGGATITINGAATEYKTDAAGKVALTFDTAGTYHVSATGENIEFKAPLCVVTVSAAQPEGEPAGEGGSTDVAEGDVPAGEEPGEQPEGENAEQQIMLVDVEGASAGTEIPFNGGTIDIIDKVVGPSTLTQISIYSQANYKVVPTITKVTQIDNTINVTLAEDTDPAFAMQAGFIGSGGAVKTNNNKCTLSNGFGTMNCEILVYQGYGAPAPVASAYYTINYIVPMGESLNVNLPTGDGFTVNGNNSVYSGSSYNFTVSVAEGYDGANMVVKANDTPLTGTDGSYTVENVTEELTITVEGVTKKETCSITLESGDGYTLSGENFAYKGEKYMVSVYVKEGYDGTAMVVKANGKVLENPTGGSYVIDVVEEDITITVEGVVKKVVCTITAPEGEGFTFTGAGTVYKGESYTFTIAVDGAYNAADMVVKANGVPVTGNSGSYTIESVTENLTITVEGVVKKEVCTITAPEGEGFTFTGAENVYKGESYIFTIAVDGAYNAADMVVKANGVPVTGTNGSYTIAAVNEDTDITVEGIVKKEVCTITAPAEGKYTFTGASTVYKGENYTFTLKANAGYVATVMVNGEPVTGINGSYTIEAVSENLTITAEVQRAPLPDKELTVTDNVIDITDKTIYSLISSIYANATNIKIEGVTVKEAYEDGTTVYIVLPYDTADDADISVTFGTALKSCTVSGHTGSIALETGEGNLQMTLTGKFSNSKKGSVTYNLIFIRELPAAEVPVCVKTTDTAEVWKDRTLEIDLDEYFTGAETYYLVDGNNKAAIDGAVYTYTPNKAGEHALKFTASNLIGECQNQLTITVTVKEIENGVYIGHATSNGSLEHVTFTDGEGNPIEGLEAVYANKTITVSLPKTYPLDGKVTATFVRTANSDGYPFLSSSNAFNQGTGSRTDVFTNTLSAGAAMRTAYLYNSKPSATNNYPEGFTIVYAIVNELPTLASGQAAGTEATVTAGQPFTFDLSKIFTDADGDALNYLVSVNGAASVAADAAYNYTTDTAGTYTLVFTANDGKGTSTDTYTVTLTVNNSAETNSMTVCVPDGLNPKFYVSSGYGTDGIDILGEEITAVKGTDGAYTLDYPKNASMISVRTDNYGGMAFTAEEGSSIVLRCVELSVVDYENKAAVSTNTVTYDGHTAPAGTAGWLLAVGGSYTYTAVPANTTDFKTAVKTETLTEGPEPYAVELMLGMNNAITITTTTGATARLYNYDINKYYYATEIAPKIIENHDDGTITYYFSANGNCLIYHVSMPGKITKAGYFGWNQKSVTVLYTEEDKAASYRLDDYSKTGEANSTFTEDSVLLNINGQNNLSIDVGETKTLKAYRAWEIIKISYQNYIITPNFHFTILQGDDVISLTEKESPSAGEGDWKTLTALKEGTAIIEVTYDAVEVKGGNYDGVYGASDPARTGLAVIQVGGHDDSVNFGIESKASQGSLTYSASNTKAWDAEFDTLYFTGESGQLKLAPTAAGTITEVAVSGDKGGSWTALTAEDGKYTANIVPGNNIIRVTTEKGTAYQVVRGDKVTVSVTEVQGESDSDGRIEAGEKVRVTFDGLHQPIPKMAGNYNPGYRGNTDGDGGVHLKYQFNGTTVEGEKTQYNFITAVNYVEITIPAEAAATSYTLSDGYIGVGVIGLTNFTSGGDSHRNIPDGGCNTRGDKTTFHTRSMLPDITITTGEEAAPNSAPYVVPGSITEDTIEEGKYYPVPLGTIFADKDGDALTYAVSVNDGEAEEAKADYKYFAAAAGTYTLKFTATDGKENSETAVHTITLTVTKKEEKPQEPTGPQFNVPGSIGSVTVSFEDFAKRVEGEKGLTYPNPLGTIVSATSVPFAAGDTIADVTLRLLDAYGIGASYSGTTKNGFYLGAITHFEVDNTPYTSMGEFDAGQGSGWMITHNGIFINQGASQFTVKNGDVIQWQYTCQLGKDIGDPFYDDKKEEEEVKDVTTSTGTSGSAGATTTTPTDVKLDEEASTATATVTRENVAETIKQAAENNVSEIVVQVSAADSRGAAKIEVKLDTSAVKDVVNKTEAQLTVKTQTATVTLDRETLKTVAAEAAGNTVTLEVSKVAQPTLAQKAAAGEKGHIIQLTIKSGNKTISLFNEGRATVTAEIPKKLDGRKVAAIHIADDGTTERLEGEMIELNGKMHYRFHTPHFSTFALIDDGSIDGSLTMDEVKALMADLTPVARSVKTPKKNIKVTLKLDETDQEIIGKLKDAGYTVKYHFYRSDWKKSGYKSMLVKDTPVYTNTKGGTGNLYFYRAIIEIYDAEGNMTWATDLMKCKYAKRCWTK